MKKSRFSGKSIFALSAAICCVQGSALAVQTYTDSIGDYAGGSATAPPPGDSYEDISNVIITNNSTNIYFQINLAPADGGHTTDILTTAQSYGKYQIGMETVPGAGNTAVSNPYNPIGISTGMNYWIDSWTNQGGGGTDASPDFGDNQVFNFTGGTWVQTAGNGLATDIPGNPQYTQTALTQTSITLTISLAALGLSIGNKFNFDVATTFDGGAGAVDALDSGAAATSESSPTYINPYAGAPANAYDSATAPGSTYATTIYTVSTPTFTWNNNPASAGGDGVTWDSSSFNWNNGIFADTYTNGSNVIFDDNHATTTSYAVTLNTVVTPASVVLNNSAGNYTISGTGSIGGTGSFTKSGTGKLTLSTANTYSGGTIVNAGLLEIMRTSATTSALPKGAVTITGGTLQLATNVTAGSQSSPNPASNVNITSLSITGNGTLDINNNHIIIDYTAGNDPIASIAAWIKSGYAGGAWTGTGIMSTAAQSNSGSYGIGYADAADPGNPAGLSSGQIEVMYTLLGDANLDGAVNGSDFAILASNFNKAVSGWDQGDFNYDGAANGADFALLASNFNKGASQAADLAALDSFATANGLMADVPEPVSGTLVVLLGMCKLTRRRARLH